MKSLNIRKKLVTLAVASVVSGGAMMAMTAPAHAMNVSQNNVGEVLLFPYYTVKNGFDTVFTVTNTSDKTAVFKVRFREALNSREVRDFNVILSPHDHWAAAVTSYRRRRPGSHLRQDLYLAATAGHGLNATARCGRQGRSCLHQRAVHRHLR